MRRNASQAAARRRSSSLAAAAASAFATAEGSRGGVDTAEAAAHDASRTLIDTDDGAGEDGVGDDGDRCDEDGKRVSRSVADMDAS